MGESAIPVSELSDRQYDTLIRLYRGEITFDDIYEASLDDYYRLVDLVENQPMTEFITAGAVWAYGLWDEINFENGTIGYSLLLKTGSLDVRLKGTLDHEDIDKIIQLLATPNGQVAKITIGIPEINIIYKRRAGIPNGIALVIPYSVVGNILVDGRSLEVFLQWLGHFEQYQKHKHRIG